MTKYAFGRVDGGKKLQIKAPVRLGANKSSQMLDVLWSVTVATKVDGTFQKLKNMFQNLE